MFDNIEIAKYYPYGDRLESQGDLGTDKLFTGQRLDDTGLYYYGARYYDPTIGRFISADPVIKSMANPQNFNRYSYVLNNPLKYIDPSGLFPVGHAIRDDETYILDKENGQYRVVGFDDTASGWYGSWEEFQEAWGGYVEQYGGDSDLVEWQEGKTYEIPVYDKKLFEGPIEVVALVPESSGRAWLARRFGAIGQSLPIVGSFVRYERYDDVIKLVKDIKHEWFHDYERRTQSNWDTDYVAYSIGGWIQYGGDKPGYNANPKEVNARQYAGTDPYPWGYPVRRSLWQQGFGEKIMDWLCVDNK